MKLARLTKYAAIGAVAGIAAYASYTHMRELALEHGQTETVASLLPVSVDGMLIVATLVMREDRQAGLKVRRWAWVAFILGVAASVVANVLAAADDITSRVISAWPAIALLLVIEVLATGKRAAVLPGEAGPEPEAATTATKPAETVAEATELPGEAGPEPEAVKPVRAPRKAAAASKGKPAKATPRRPVEQTRALAEAALTSSPEVTRKQVAEQLEITPRRLRQVLNEDTGEQGKVNGELPGQLSLA